MKRSAQDLVKEFITTYRQPLRTELQLDVPEKELRYQLIREEFHELVDAQKDNDFIEVVDAWADLIYVLYGAGLTHGVDLDAEIQKRYGTTDLVAYFAPMKFAAPCLYVKERDLVQQEVAQTFQRYDYVHHHTNDVHLTAECFLDLIHVVYKAAALHGVNLAKVLDEVQASNMSKLDADGEPIFREDGKVIKGPNFFAPDISKVLARQEG